jgi:carboxypeptidase Taq
MFDRLRPRLVALRDRVLGAPQPNRLDGEFPAEGQLALSRDLARPSATISTAGGWTWRCIRSAPALARMCGSPRGSIPADPLNCFYSTIHEVGHAAYEQGIDPAYGLTAIGQGASMGVHESQSRIYENQLGRSRAFTGWLFGRMRDLSAISASTDADAFYATATASPPASSGPRRTRCNTTCTS